MERYGGMSGDPVRSRWPPRRPGCGGRYAGVGTELLPPHGDVIHRRRGSITRACVAQDLLVPIQRRWNVLVAYFLQLGPVCSVCWLSLRGLNPTGKDFLVGGHKVTCGPHDGLFLLLLFEMSWPVLDWTVGFGPIEVLSLASESSKSSSCDTRTCNAFHLVLRARKSAASNPAGLFTTIVDILGQPRRVTRCTAVTIPGPTRTQWSVCLQCLTQDLSPVQRAARH